MSDIKQLYEQLLRQNSKNRTSRVETYHPPYETFNTAGSNQDDSGLWCYYLLRGQTYYSRGQYSILDSQITLPVLTLNSLALVFNNSVGNSIRVILVACRCVESSIRGHFSCILA
jgi:hypothetical protein